MKKLFLALFLFLTVTFTTSCNERENYAVTILRDDSEVAQAGLSGQVNKDEALSTIAKASDTAANKLDPEKKIQPDTTAPKIVEAQKLVPAGQPNPEMQKVISVSISGPLPGGLGSLGWGGIAGTALVLIGAAGKFMGPPWNVGGALLQGLGSRLVPNYDRNKKAAVGTIVATEQMLGDYGSLLDTMPEVKAKLKDKLGGADPVDWMKGKLESAHQDLGVHEEVAGLMSVMKQQMTTKDGVLTPKVEEVDSFLAKHI